MRLYMHGHMRRITQETAEKAQNQQQRQKQQQQQKHSMTCADVASKERQARSKTA